MGFWKIWGLEAATADEKTDTCIRPETPNREGGMNIPFYSSTPFSQGKLAGPNRSQEQGNSLIQCVRFSLQRTEQAGLELVRRRKCIMVINDPFLFRSSCSQSSRSADFKHCVIETRLDYKPQYLN